MHAPYCPMHVHIVEWKWWCCGFICSWRQWAHTSNVERKQVNFEDCCLLFWLWLCYQCHYSKCYDTHTHTHLFNGPLFGTTRVSRYWKGKTNLDFTEARDSEGQWHQLGHMQICTLLQTNNHISTPPLSFLHVGCPSCCPTNSVKVLIIVIVILEVMTGMCGQEIILMLLILVVNRAS